MLLILINLSYCSKDTATNTKASTANDLLVKDNAISGWTRSGIYWTANSSSELTDRINGGAEVYTNRGFVEAAMQTYQGKILDNFEMVELFIYDQETVENTKLVFDEISRQLSNSTDLNSSVGIEAKMEYLPGSQKIIFYKSKFFVSISITSDSEEALEVLKIFAASVDSNI